MVALVLTGLFCVLVTLGFRGLFAKWLDELDPQEAYGVAGLVGLGLVGTLTVVLGLIPGFLRFGMMGVGALIVVLAGWSAKKHWGGVFAAKKPEGLAFGVLAGIALMAVFPLIATQVPSTSLDWDSLAYHLAVPKLWLSANQVTWVQTIHHSNFPFALDALYLYGLTFAGEFGAKAFMFFVMLLGARALFGLASRWGAGKNAIWAPLAFMASPVVLWESGTAYIDVGHGLYAGLGVLYVAEMVWRLRKDASLGSLPLVSALFWGLALGTKLTGLQTFIVAGFLFLVFGYKSIGKSLRPAAVIAGVALLIALPWFGKSEAFTGNPVFPFFFEQFGGKGWDQWRADIYKNEQQTFGVGRRVDEVTGKSSRDVLKIGDAILGLAYQPGRYTNPGQTVGSGFPTGAIGFLALLAFIIWAVSGKAGPREKFLLAWVGLTFFLWFFLSQQSRYLTFLVVPAAVLVATGVGKLQLGKVLAGGAVVQALATLYVLVNFGFADQIKVMTGALSPEAYRRGSVSFADVAEVINNNNEITEVALFDEVFGYLLNKKYFWANPGHSNRIPFETMTSSDDLVAELKKQEISHVYMALMFGNSAARDRWLASTGLVPGEPMSEEERQGMLSNREVAWKVLLADAVKSGHLTVASEPINPRGILFKVQ
ncbi:MAG: ArnT family glycosyltransferase [Fimbriimonadaceae bacterium]